MLEANKEIVIENILYVCKTFLLPLVLIMLGRQDMAVDCCVGVSRSGGFQSLSASALKRE